MRQEYNECNLFQIDTFPGIVRSSKQHHADRLVLLILFWSAFSANQISIVLDKCRDHEILQGMSPADDIDNVILAHEGACEIVLLRGECQGKKTFVKLDTKWGYQSSSPRRRETSVKGGAYWRIVILRWWIISTSLSL